MRLFKKVKQYPDKTVVLADAIIDPLGLTAGRNEGGLPQFLQVI